MSTAWSPDDLEAIAATDEIEIAPQRSDGAAASFTTIWVVRIGDDFYIRSYRGPDGSWYRAARRTHEGSIRVGGIERMVTFDEDHGAKRTEIDDAYRAKYGRSSYVDAMATPDAATTTLRLLPRRERNA
jgi:hypothetical protein